MAGKNNVDLNDDFWKEFKPKVIKTEDASDSDNSGSDGSDGKGKSIDWLPWISAGGSALLSHSLASSLFDDDDHEKNKSVWYRLLKALFPAGAGALGAWGGYELAKSMKTAQDNTVDPGATYSVEVPGGKRYSVPGYHMGTFKDVTEWGREKGYTEGTPPYVVADDKASNNDRWGLGQAIGSGASAAGGLWGLGTGLYKSLKPTDDNYVELYPPSEVEKARASLARKDAPIYTDQQKAEMNQKINDLNAAVDKRVPLQVDVDRAKNSTVGVLNSEINAQEQLVNEAYMNNKNPRVALERLHALRNQLNDAQQTGAGYAPDSLVDTYRADMEATRNRLNNVRPSEAELTKATAVMDAVNSGKNRRLSWKQLAKNAWRSGGIRNLLLSAPMFASSLVLGNMADSNFSKARRARALSEALKPPSNK